MHQHSKIFIAISREQKLIISSMYSKEIEASTHRFQLMVSKVT